MLRKSVANLVHAFADAIGGIDSQADRESRTRAQELLARISMDAEERLALAEREAERREELALLDADVPDRWTSYYYMRQGYRVSTTDDESQGHWRGGPPQHDGAKCPVCRKPLLLFWDVACDDPRFRAESPELFGDLERLPLYYCCRRPEPTIYQVLSQDRIRTIRPELEVDEDSPFEDFPDEFARKPVRLEPIPRDIANLRIISQNFASGWLETDEVNRLTEYFGDRHDSLLGMRMSQFGGAPIFIQGHEGIECPNPSCSTHKMGHPLMRNPIHFQMKELAVIDVDAGFEMESNYAQIVFHICWKCLTVQGGYHCD